MTRAAAALADLAVDDVEDLQMAIDEAATVLLPLVAPDGDRRLRATFEVGTSGLSIELRARCRAGERVDRSGLAWMMLTALDAEVDVVESDDEVAIAVGRARPGAAGG
jgi:serine/threonine-protein kinase RsbW